LAGLLEERKWGKAKRGAGSEATISKPVSGMGGKTDRREKKTRDPFPESRDQ